MFFTINDVFDIFVLYKIKKRNSNKKIWFIENNVDTHKKVFKITQIYKNENDIFIVDWFFNSSYFHSIENVWKTLKKRLKFTWKKIRETSKQIKFKTYKIINEMWNSKYLLMKTNEKMLKWFNKLQQCYDFDDFFNFKN